MSVLTAEFAQKFIQKTVRNLPFNVNIMDDKGVIIASKDSSRIGDFHEVAHGLLSGTMNTGVVTENDHYLGTRPGINMFIDYKGQHVGVICVTGNPDSVRSFAGFVKTSMETMLDYEIRMAQEQRTRGREEKFLHYLLFTEKYEHDEACRMAEFFGIGATAPAVVICLDLPPGVADHAVIRALSHGNSTVQHHIVMKGRADDFVILKIFPPYVGESVRHFRQITSEYIEESLNRMADEIPTESQRFYVGSMQSRLDDYRKSFHHAQNLSLHQKNPERVNFLYDHIMDVFRAAIPLNFYRDMFEVFNQALRDEERSSVIDTVRALSAGNYNIMKAAKELSVHRNTVQFRLNKIRDLLSVDPASSRADREFLNELVYYLEKTT